MSTVSFSYWAAGGPALDEAGSNVDFDLWGLGFPHTPAGTAWTHTPSDSVAVSDAISNGPNLGKSDSVAITDAAVKAVGQGLSDSVAISDALAKAIAAVIADSFAITDSLAAAYAAILADSVAISDSRTSSIVNGIWSSVEDDALAYTEIAETATDFWTPLSDPTTEYTDL